ncbi:MAG: helicase [Geoglossum umbratile]|nr:MAG: helicase [Geoglossum umbratile]
MINKPFRPPLLKQAPRSPVREEIRCPDEQPSKRRRVNSNKDDGAQDNERASIGHMRVVAVPRKPLLRITNPAAAVDSAKSSSNAVEGYYTVLWRKFTNKKHKTWDGDGVLSVVGGYAHLQDVSGASLGKTTLDSPLLPGSTLSISGKEVEIDSVLPRDDFMKGRPFLPTKVQVPIAQENRNKPIPAKVSRPLSVVARRADQVVPPAPTKRFKNPLLSSTVLPKNDDREPTPRHDPGQKGALVMKRPTTIPKNRRIVDVVVDPTLGQHLREHQKEGVKFMYECVMGMRPFDGQGAILADEMGLGKTLQTIALLWTLLKQNPIYEAQPVIKKALIVCPVTLIKNWRKEFRKWLGNERIGVFLADDKKVNLRDFTMGKSYSVMIIGYEKLRMVQQELMEGSGIDIVVADEGHRLKTAQNKSAQAIKALNTPRRIILSGTPIQNDLSEFFVMVDFVNPGLLGAYNTFKKEFENPIIKSRQPGAARKDVDKGSARSEELASLTKMFILRRTAEILSKYLPPKAEYVLFCRPTTAQVNVYRAVLESPAFSNVLGNTEASLQLITLLKKVCNSPTLLASRKDGGESSNGSISTLLSSIDPAVTQSSPVASSGKMRVLDCMLRILKETTEEKIVLVSNYTSTLDLLQNLLTARGLNFLRLDGSTPNTKRQDLVDTFNTASSSKYFAFLLSAKSGGAGLNLIGASRLVLFEVDWNPSTDLQAMARIHRDGQRRDVKIYRLLTTGGLDEKIYQRQLTKQGLADSVMDNKASASIFTQSELRDLFSLDTESLCQTHDLLGCGCHGRGIQTLPPNPGKKYSASLFPEDSDDNEFPELPQLISASKVNVAKQEREIQERRKAMKSKGSNMQSLMEYAHVDTSVFTGDASDELVDEMESLINDDVLLKVLRGGGNRVSFIFSKPS